MKYAQLITAIDTTSQRLLSHAVVVVNQTLVMRNWLVGAYIVEFEQKGEDRAKYGQKLLEKLAADLKSRHIEGLSVQMLERTRQLFFIYPQIGRKISSSLMEDLDIHFIIKKLAISSSLMRKSRKEVIEPVPQPVVPDAESACAPSLSPGCHGWHQQPPFCFPLPCGPADGRTITHIPRK